MKKSRKPSEVGEEIARLLYLVHVVATPRKPAEQAKALAELLGWTESRVATAMEELKALGFVDQQQMSS